MLIKINYNIITSLIFIILGIFMFVRSLDFPSSNIVGMPGPSTFPEMIAIAMVFTSLILLLYSIISTSKVIKKYKKDISVRKALLFIIGITIYISLLNYIGFVFSSFLFVAYLMILMQGFNRKIIVKSLLISLTMVIIINFVFAELFNVTLPTGLVFN